MASVAAFLSGEMRFISCPHRPIRVFDRGVIYPDTEGNRAAADEPWLLFSNTDDFKPREIMKLYSRRMQIEQNFRDEKSERYGFGLRASFSRSAGRIEVAGHAEYDRAVAGRISS